MFVKLTQYDNGQCCYIKPSYIESITEIPPGVSDLSGQVREHGARTRITVGGGIFIVRNTADEIVEQIEAIEGGMGRGK